MKKILLLSDTHNHLDEQIINHASEADEIWHAGDIGSLEVYDRLKAVRPLIAVWGNADDEKIRRTTSETEIFTTEGVKVMMIHIAGGINHYKPGVADLLQLHKPDILVCGHSHILKIQRDKYGVIYINPGAAGHHGFHQTRTMIRFSMEKGQLLNMEVIELGKRGKLSQSVG